MLKNMGHKKKKKNIKKDLIFPHQGSFYFFSFPLPSSQQIRWLGLLLTKRQEYLTHQLIVSGQMLSFPLFAPAGVGSFIQTAWVAPSPSMGAGSMCAQLATGVTPLLRGVFDPTACEPQGCPEEPVWLSAWWCDSTRAAGRAWPRGTGLCVCLLQAKHGRKHLTGILLVSPQIPGVWVQTHSGMRSVAPGGLQDLKSASVYCKLLPLC